MADIDTGTDQEQPADDIRSMLGEALAQSEAPPPNTKEAPEKATETDDAPSDGRKRGPDGKFVKSETQD